MTTYRSFCVPDASVLFDFHVCDRLEQLLSLTRHWLLADLAIVEINNPSLETLRHMGMEVMEFNGVEIGEIIGLGERYPALSLPDRANLFLASRERALLLTGDRILRKIANHDFGLEVHGTLWALDRLLEDRLLTPGEAARALRQMLMQGSRLAQDECQKRLHCWERQP